MARVVIPVKQSVVTLETYLRSIANIIKTVDDVQPAILGFWTPITGDPEYDGYAGYRDGSLIESLIRHLFCKQFFTKTAGVQIDSFVMGMTDNFKSNAIVLLHLLMKNNMETVVAHMNGVALKILDSVAQHKLDAVRG